MNSDQLRALIAQHTPAPRTKPKREETELVGRLRELAPLLKAKLFRNNNGVLKDKFGHRVAYGLGKGSSDLVGYQSVVVTADMVGQTVARFVAVEVKKPGRDTSDPAHLARQQAWIDAVRAAGGVGAIVRSEEELIALLR